MQPFVKTRSVWRSKWTILLIVLGALAVRLIRIEQPFVDPWSWRQSDVAAIARNYLENGFHFGRPQIDWAGDTSGYVGTEFPILPFAAAVCYKMMGVQEWIGRMEGVIFFVAALPFFFLLVRRICGEGAAVWATFFYAFAPLSIVASRSFIPDMPSLSLAIAGVWFFLVWTEKAKRWALFVSALLLSLSFLIKITAAVIAPMLVYLAFVGRRRGFAAGKPAGLDGGSESAAPWSNGGSEARRHGESVRRRTWLVVLLARWETWIFAMIVIVPSALWYWHAYQISKTYYPYHFFGGGGFRIMSPLWYWSIAKETVLSSLTPMLSALAVLGAFVSVPAKTKWAFHWWLAAMVAFIFFAGWGNRHQWYQLPLVPIAAAFAGCFCQWTASRLQWHRAVVALVFASLVVGFGMSSYHATLPFYRPTSVALRNLGLELKEATTPQSLIVAADDGNPTVFYYAHRKGWHFLEDGLYQGPPVASAPAIADLERLRGRGASHLVFTSNTRWWFTYYPEFAGHVAKTATLVEETPEFTIYKLRPAVR
jgi:hypothetical protein